VFIILVIVYRSPLLPILVLLTSTFALCVALLTVWWLAKAGIFVLNGQVQGILFILVIGAATDYALLYTARFREAIGTGPSDGMPRSWPGAAPSSRSSPRAAPSSRACCACCSATSPATARSGRSPRSASPSRCCPLTFLPALLAIFGRAAFWPFIPKGADGDPGDNAERLVTDPNAPVRGFWGRQARLVARHARPVWIVSTVVLLAASVGVLQLKADGVPQSDLVLGASQARDGQDVLAQHFAAGSGAPRTSSCPRTASRMP
jgi:RND superfamily putative drug exporter